MSNYPAVGMQIPKVLIPNKSISMEKWSVVACDQYTSQPDYWDKVNHITLNSPSTYHLILPEAYLGTPKEKEHQSQIFSFMKSYLASNLFEEYQGFVLVERKLGHKTRQGLIMALDLEQYDFNKDSQSLIRATEGTIIERLPPRVEIREKAAIEIPHILVLIDDPQFSVIEPLSAEQKSFQRLYDFELMLGGGHISGSLINDRKLERKITLAFENLKNADIQNQKYGIDSHPLLYAVGDGNHSLAAAKSYWERIKDKVSSKHPARFALVEVVNIHNQGIEFEPIHRLVKNVKFNFLETLLTFFPRELNVIDKQDFHSLKDHINNQRSDYQLIGIIADGNFQIIKISKPRHSLPVGSIQLFLDDLILKHPEIKLDFIHGDDALLQLASQPNSIGIYLPSMQKSSLFKSVIKDGPLPRKTFSMGEAHEKRYYLECRRIYQDGC